MKKFFLIVFMLLDVAMIAASVMFLMSRLKMNQTTMQPYTPITTPATIPSTVASTSTVAASTFTAAAPATPVASVTPGTPLPAGASTGSHKIGFKYRNSKAKKVMIRADFTGWRAEPMQKEPGGTWTYMAVLEPGEYAYCFSVDDRSIRDPANKRTKKIGNTFVSSIVVPASAAPH